MTIDSEDDEVEINFLEKSGKNGKVFKIPSKEDKILIDRSEILTVLQNQPMAIGRSKRFNKTFQIKETDSARAENIFHSRIKKP